MILSFVFNVIQSSPITIQIDLHKNVVHENYRGLEGVTQQIPSNSTYSPQIVCLRQPSEPFQSNITTYNVPILPKATAIYSVQAHNLNQSR